MYNHVNIFLQDNGIYKFLDVQKNRFVRPKPPELLVFLAGFVLSFSFL
jgi:hypothetical protein